MTRGARIGELLDWHLRDPNRAGGANAAGIAIGPVDAIVSFPSLRAYTEVHRFVLPLPSSATHDDSVSRSAVAAIPASPAASASGLRAARASVRFEQRDAVR